MNGKITVKSHYQKGTTFIFQISLDLSQKQMVTQIDLPINISMPNFEEENNDEPTQVLIVEDNDINQLVLSGLLKKLGHNKITCANNGKIGLEKFIKGNFDIVFMDCQMPIMDGFEATRRIRSLDDPKNNTPIIAITANAMTTAREECLKAGMSEYITKPIQEIQLKEIYDHFTGISPQEPEPMQSQNEVLDFEFDGSNLRALEDTELVEQVICSYDSSMENEINKLNTAFQSQNYEDSRFVIHAIQGLAGNIGALEVYKRAKELTASINKRGFENSNHLLDSLIKTNEESKIILHNFLKDYK